MKNIKQVCSDELDRRIDTMRSMITSAELCREDDDFLQCAVRLQKAAEQAQFDPFLMDIFESVSK